MKRKSGMKVDTHLTINRLYDANICYKLWNTEETSEFREESVKKAFRKVRADLAEIIRQATQGKDRLKT